jgi:DNA-directed RNA polymerase specialized sigma24 family protein
MNEFETFRPISLTNERRAELSRTMAEAHPVLCRAAEEKFGKPQARRLRNAYKRDRDVLWCHPTARSHMLRMEAIEDTVLRGYILLSASVCNSFARKPRAGVCLGDYVAECADAIYDAMYTYDGSTLFHTYVHRIMSNRLICFVRTQNRLSGMGKLVRKVYAEVQQAMSSRLINFDSALAFVAAGRDFDDGFMKRVRAAHGHNVSLDETASFDDREETSEDVRLAIEKAGLNEVEKELIDGFMHDDRGCRKRMIRERTNPGTGRAYNAARLSQIFIEAKEKVGRSYRRLAA